MVELHVRITRLGVILAALVVSATAWAQPPMPARPMSARSKPARPAATRPDNYDKYPVRQASAKEMSRAAASQSDIEVADAGAGPAVYMAQHPNPNEPLGFSESRFQLGSPVDPGWDSGLLDYQPMELAEPVDPEGPAPAVSSGEWIRSGCWYTSQEVIYFSRSTSPKNEIRLATDIRSAAVASDLAHLDISPNAGGYAPGWRGTLGRYIGRDPRNRDHSVEFTFLGLTHWGDGASLTAKSPGSIFSNIDPTNLVPVFNASNFQSYRQTTQLNSFELNYRIARRLGRDQLVYSRDSTWVRRCDRALLPAVFAGVRGVAVPEKLEYLAESAAGNGSYNIATHNNLFGLQGGAELFYEHYEWRFGGKIFGGGLVNWANQSTAVRTPTVTRDEFAEDHELSFVGGMTFQGAYQFTPNFAFRTSYDLLWVTNLALAQNQITFAPSNPPQMSVHHGLFYQGASIGLEWTR